MSEPKRMPVDIVRVEEPWAIAHLADGTQVKLKIVFDQALRNLDAKGNPAFETDGQPSYWTTFKYISAVNAPDAAKQKVKP